MTSILSFLTTHATWVSAAGLVGLAIFQATSGNYAGAIQSLLGAFAALGIHLNVAQTAATVEEILGSAEHTSNRLPG